MNDHEATEMSEPRVSYLQSELWKMLADAWASGYWHGTTHEGPLNDAVVEAKNPYKKEQK